MLRADATGVMKVPKPSPKHSGCTHDLCAADRTIAASPCAHCGEPIGFNTEYLTRDQPGDFVPPFYTHAACDLPESSQFKPKVQTSGRNRRHP